MRMIDADKLKEMAIGAWHRTPQTACMLDAICDIIDATPTIKEEENEEN